MTQWWVAGLGIPNTCQLATACSKDYPVIVCAIQFGRTDQPQLTVRLFDAFFDATAGPP